MVEYSDGAAYVDGRYLPVAEAMVLTLGWSYRWSDMANVVAGVWDCPFLRVDDYATKIDCSEVGLA